jgi:hypothetical protein
VIITVAVQAFAVLAPVQAIIRMVSIPVLLVDQWVMGLLYMNRKKLPPIRLDALKTLKNLFHLGNAVRSKRLSAD